MTQPRGKPPSQAPPPVGRGRNALTALGGGVLVLAVAGGAWALFGRDDTKAPTALGPRATATATAPPVFGPVAPGKAKPPAAVTPTTVGPVAATASTKPAATSAPTAAPTKAAATSAPTAARTAGPTATKAPVVKSPAVTPPVAAPPVAGPQQAGTVAKKAYSFRVARGDTLWGYAKRTLSATGRPTTNANVTAYVAKLYAHNRGVIGANPDLIVPGQTVVWPSGL